MVVATSWAERVEPVKTDWTARYSSATGEAAVIIKELEQMMLINPKSGEPSVPGEAALAVGAALDEQKVLGRIIDLDNSPLREKLTLAIAEDFNCRIVQALAGIAPSVSEEIVPQRWKILLQDMAAGIAVHDGAGEHEISAAMIKKIDASYQMSEALIKARVRENIEEVTLPAQGTSAG